MGLLYEMVLKKKQSALLALTYKRMNNSEAQLSPAERVQTLAALHGLDHKSAASLNRVELMQL
ncbi:hypothetical protein [Paenibacillus radicis (ex Gao et al. 2016)]|uniref:Uncharacterized protein n=1 Tax=Paenibacillus radicis (ex Gao et al. 2016) TaxID=1737354 RepID=A0A917H365_9BACL|nr:hypothetical protein [Paenibacillus radicis (ex Gao et al. 2016)]GGG66040.1 hypothetical protein GCM10010918_20500 [Paenibacillus radicis (ex Gao et al. 2016)]